MQQGKTDCIAQYTLLDSVLTEGEACSVERFSVNLRQAEVLIS